MNISISKNNGEAKVYFVFDNCTVLGNSSLDLQITNQIKYLTENNEYDKKMYSLSYLNDYKEKERNIFIGIGSSKSLNCEIIRKAVYYIVKFCMSKSIESISIKFEDNDSTSQYIKSIAESAILSSYKYTKYLTNTAPSEFKNIYLDIKENETNKQNLKESISLANSVNEARDLVNEPANIQTPEKLADEALELGDKYGFETEIFDENQIINLGMNAFYEVSKGSVNKAKLIVMRYFGNETCTDILGLVGKGITFDSGGLNLKSGNRFITMKHDMAGAATVIGAMCAIAQNKLNINVVAVVAACENAISGNAYKPGDIINSKAGKTILINSTDAEGRLTLIDAIQYAIKNENATKIVDIATLTGAARRMLAHYGSPFVCNNEELNSVFNKASQETDEIICRIPLIEEALKSLKCDIADYYNTTLDDVGGMLTTSLFIREFVENKPWLHIDAAGPLWLEKEFYYQTKGGSGWGCRTLYYLAKNLCGNTITTI